MNNNNKIETLIIKNLKKHYKIKPNSQGRKTTNAQIKKNINKIKKSRIALPAVKCKVKSKS